MVACNKHFPEILRAFQVWDEPQEIETFSGDRVANPGDYVVIFESGDRGIFSRDAFESMYIYYRTDEELYEIYTRRQRTFD